MLSWRADMNIPRTLLAVAAPASCLSVGAWVQEPARPDTSVIFRPSTPGFVSTVAYRPLVHSWGIDIMLSNNGFGLGAFYRRQFTDDLACLLTFAISDVKVDGENEYFTYSGTSYVPGKKNRLLMLPLIASIQYRLFRDDIVDNFRPYLSGGAGPTMMFVAPYARFTDIPMGDGTTIRQSEKIEFFESLKYGKAQYTVGGYIGGGAYFGKDKSNVMGLSIRYYFVRFPSGIEVLQGGYMKEFGGLYITLNFGSSY